MHHANRVGEIELPIGEGEAPAVVMAIGCIRVIRARLIEALEGSINADQSSDLSFE
jgi:hypothetical protein